MANRGIFNFIAFIFFTLLTTHLSGQSTGVDADKLEKEANECFENKDYECAKGLYSQLTTFFPDDPNYNYRFGACMLFVDKDKNYPLKFLEFAVSKPNVEPEAFFYLARGYHYNYRFRNAIEYYEKYKARASAKMIKELNVDQLIMQCHNGLNLLTNISEPVVLDRKKLNEGDFFLAYKLDDIRGRILRAPEELRSAVDKKMGYYPLMYRNKDEDIIYFSSYGPNKNNGIDIYSVSVTGDGKLSDPYRLPDAVNTPYDDAFPFMSKNGTDFYFASKGHTSMGGYDIFHIKYDPLTNTWGQAVNMDYAINTPDDDFMYAVSKSGGYAYFASNRNSEFGKVYVFKIEPETKPLQFTILAGNFKSENTRSAKITVEDVNKNEEIGSFSTEKESGKYVMKLENGGTFRFLVTPFGSDVTYSGVVVLPNLKELRPLKQEMEIVTENGEEKLIIRNLFEEKPSAEDELLLAQQLMEASDIGASAEGKEALDVNMTDDEILADIAEAKKTYESKSAEFSGSAAKLYEIARLKQELARQDFDLATQLEAAHDDNDRSEAAMAKRNEIDQLYKDARQHLNEAKGAVMLAEMMETAAETEEDKAVLASRYYTAVQDAGQTGNREKLVETYLEYNQEMRKLGGVRDIFEVKRKLELIAQTRLQNADEVLQQANDLSTKLFEIEEDIKYYKKQLEQTKDKQIRSAISQEIADLEAEQKEVQEQKDMKFAEAERLFAEAEEFDQEVKSIENYLDEVLESESSVALQAIDKKAINDQIAQIDSKLDMATRAEIESESGAIAGEVVGGAATETVAAGEPASESATADVPDEGLPLIAKDELGNPYVLTENDIVAKSSVYEDYYKEELQNVASQNEDDEYELIRSSAAINKQWKDDMDAEIAFIETYLKENPDTPDKKKLESKLQALKKSSQKKSEEIANAMQILAGFNTDITEYGPDPELMVYDKVNDLEEKYYQQYVETDYLDNEEARLGKLNELNKKYVADAKADIAALVEENKSLPPSSPLYKQNLSEIAALQQVIVSKEEGIGVYEERLLAQQSTEEETQTPDQTAGEAGTQQETGTTEEEVIAQTGETTTETTGETSGEEVPIQVAAGTVLAEESAKEEEQLPFEGYVETENSQTIVVDGELIPLVISPETGKREYSEEELKGEAVVLGEAPYNETYAAQFEENSKNPDMLAKAQGAQKINYNWLVDTEKEIAILEYAILQSDDEEFIAKAEEKLVALNEQANQKRSQLRLNAMLINQLKAQEAAQVAEADIPAQEETTAEAEETTTAIVEETAETSGETLAESAVETPAEAVVEGAVAGAEMAQETEGITQEESAVEQPQASGEPVEPITEEPVATETSSELAGETTPVAVIPAEEVGYPEPTPVYVEQAAAEKQETLKKLEAKQAELSAVEAEIAITRKKKKRIELEKQADVKRAEVRYEQRRAELLEERGSKIAEAQQRLFDDPMARPLSEDLKEDLSFKKDQLEFLQQEMIDLDNLIGETKKKKKRRELQEKLAPMVEEEKLLALEVSVLEGTVAEVVKAEEQTLKESTPFGRELVVKLPGQQRVLTLEEQTLIENTPEYKEYDRAKMEFSVKVKEAEVLYESAGRKEAEGKKLLSDAANLLKASEALPPEEQFTAREQADQLKKQGDDLLSQAAEERNEARQLKHEAYYEMNKANARLLEVQDEVLKNNIIAMVSGSVEQPVLTPENIDSIPEVLTYEIFLEDTTGSTTFYNEEKPIPIDPPLPEGLVFKVQVGAFRNPIKPEVFRGFAPITGERTPGGLTKYTAGLFKDYPAANEARQGIRELGYSDAFVVAYLNGKRISVTEARRMTGNLPPLTRVTAEGDTVIIPPGSELAAGTETTQEATSGTGTPGSRQPATSYEIPEDINLPVEKQETRIIDSTVSPEVKNVNEQPELFFTVQIGVYSSEVSPDKLFNITPLNQDVTETGLIRYSTGVYPSIAEAASARSRIVQIGISDAFVTAYYKGKRITVAEALKLGKGQSPVIEPVGGSVEEVMPQEQTPQTVQPDEVEKVDTANGVKIIYTTGEGIEEETETEQTETIIPTVEVPESTETPADNATGTVYKVMVGPYEGKVPVIDAAVILQLTSLGIEHIKEGETTYYKIGNYANKADAEELLRTIEEKGLANPKIIEE